MSSKTKKLSFDKMRTIFFFALIIILGIVMLYIFRPFLYPIFWAGIIVIMFYPIHNWIKNHIKKSGASAFLALIIVIITVFIPLTILSILLVDKSIDLYSYVGKSEIFQEGKLISWVENSPLAPYMDYIKNEWVGYATKISQSLSSFLVKTITNITANSLRFLMMTLIMFYSIYYFFKDGAKFLKKLMYLSPLGDKYEEMLFSEFRSTTRATLKSTIIIGVIQGILSGLLFLITGIKGAFVWGVIMTILAIIPAIGSPLILLPASIIMLATGNIWQAIVLIVGAWLVSTVDNLLRPHLVGRDTQMHPLIVFFSTLGGLVMFGVSGFVIGPIIAALFISILSIYDHYYKNELQNN